MINFFQPKRVLNKWHFFFQIFKNAQTGKGYVGLIGFLKWVSFPEKGESITKENYKGFFKDFTLWG